MGGALREEGDLNELLPTTATLGVTPLQGTREEAKKKLDRERCHAPPLHPLNVATNHTRHLCLSEDPFSSESSIGSHRQVLSSTSVHLHISRNTKNTDTPLCRSDHFSSPPPVNAAFQTHHSSRATFTRTLPTVQTVDRATSSPS